MHVGLPFFRALHAKRADHHRGISVDLHVALLSHDLGRLIVRGLNAGQELALGGNAAVDIDGDKGVCKDHVQSLGVLGLEGVIPGVFKRQNAPSFVVNVFLLSQYHGNAQEQNPNGHQSPFHGCTLRTDTGNRDENMLLA